jgi:diguanylate cyclase (GGDEF)-like protein
MTPTSRDSDLQDLHVMAEMLGQLDVGLVVLDENYQVHFWNAFMENHSGVRSHRAEGRDIFSLFPDLDAHWFRKKVGSVMMLNTRAFTTWEQRPYMFRFPYHRPISSATAHMYQNTTLLPLTGLSGKVDRVAILIYDVTDMAIGRQALSKANADLQRLSRTDRLTGLNNRGYWEECLGQEFARQKRYGPKSSLVIFDIDHFKKINDHYGHQAGDEVIRTTAQLLMRNMRNSDIAGRYGGEEYVVLLVDTASDGAVYFAERLRKSVESQSITYNDQTIRWTISLGVSQAAGEMAAAKDWLEAADQALYRSKQGGRNRHTLAMPSAA